MSEGITNGEAPKKKNWFERHKVLSVIIAIIAFFSIIGTASNHGGTSTTSTTPTPTPAAAAPAPVQPWDYQAAYDKIQTGMTKAQVEAVTGKSSDSCTESQSNYTGKMEWCSYGNVFTDKGTVSVTYINDKVSDKTKYSH